MPSCNSIKQEISAKEMKKKQEKKEEECGPHSMASDCYLPEYES